MKKIYFLSLGLCMTLLLSAQVQLTHHEIVLPLGVSFEEAAALTHPVEGINREFNPAHVAALQANPITIMDVEQVHPGYAKQVAQVRAKSPHARLAADEFYARYERPEGTLFAGIDRIGYCFWFDYTAIVGAWRQGIEAWTWRNRSAGATSYTWKSEYLGSEDYYIGKGYALDEDQNLIDSLTPALKGDLNSGLSYNVPILYAAKDELADTFMLNQPFSHLVDTLTGLCMAGAPMQISWLGETQEMWPLTNARPFVFMEMPTSPTQPSDLIGIVNANRMLITTDTAGANTYIYGSAVRQMYSPDEDKLVDVKPASVTVYYDKPQVPLYIHDITVPIARVTTTKTLGRTQTSFTTPTLKDTLRLSVMDSAGVVVHTATCATSGLTSMNYNTYALLPGRMANFQFQKTDAFGGIVSEGFTMDKEFSIKIEGLDATGNNFGLYVAFDPYEGGHTVLTDTAGLEYHDVYDPYIMLNGAFNTFEPSCVDMNLDTVVVPVHIRKLEPDFEDPYYVCVIDTGEEAGYIPTIYSTFIPVDTITNFFKNVDIKAPDWASFDAMMSYFEDYSAWGFYICDDDQQAQIGDEIILSSYGRTIVFRVVEETKTALPETTSSTLSAVTRQGNDFLLTYPSLFRSVRVLNASGQLIRQHDLPAGGRMSFDASQLPSGVYLFMLEGSNSREVLRAIK